MPQLDPAHQTPHVATFLAAARAHELNRKRHANRKVGSQHQPDYAAGVTEAQSALTLRQQAHALDPEHADPAWALDPVSNDRICEFLQAWIDLP